MGEELVSVAGLGPESTWAVCLALEAAECTGRPSGLGLPFPLHRDPPSFFFVLCFSPLINVQESSDDDRGIVV